MKTKNVLVSLLLFCWATAGMAQVVLTHTTNADFLKGSGNNVIIDNDMVSMQSKMTTMYDFEATTNLPQTLMNHQLVTWQNYVFCVGGYNGTAPVNTVYRATQQSDGVSSWTTMKALPVPLTDMAVVASQGYLIVMGGKNNDGVSNKIYVAPLDPQDVTMGEWTESSVTLPRALWGARAILVHDNIYLIGGATADNETAALKYVYCLKLNSRGNVVSASAVTNLPEARNGHAVASYDSKIYVIGGHNNSGELKKTVYCASVNLDGTLSSWSSKTSLPVALTNHTAVCTNGIMAVIGGMEDELPSSTVYYTYLDNTSLAWNVGGAVLSARTHSGASVVFDNKMFFTGGMNLSGSIVNFNRFAPLETGDDKVGKACFVSLPFDLGIPMKNVHQLSYNIAQTENTSYEVLYRLAGEDLTYGNWISGGTDNPVVIDQTKRAIQYMVRLTATGTDDIQLEDMTATMTGYTQLAGNLNNTSVLTAANSPYWATSDITFTTGVHDIDPGVVIYFTKNTGLTITYACVHFNGTESAPILLTYNNDDQQMWRGVYYTGNSSSSQNGGVYNNNVSTMNYTVIENAGKGGDNAAVRLRYASQPTFSHCTISNSVSSGFYLDYSSSPIIANCTFINNAASALYLSNSNPTVTATTFSGSDHGIHVNSGSYGVYTDCVSTGNNVGFYSYTPNRSFTYDESTLLLSDNGVDIMMSSGTISGDRTWNKYDNGYWITGGGLTIYGSNTPTLTIAPGSTVFMDAGKQIHIGGDQNSSYGGCIYAVGNATDSIHFTAKNGSSGGWGGFYFDNSSDYNASSSLRYCVVEKASTNIYLYKTTQPQLMYSTIRKASGSNISLSYSEINMDECYVSDANNGIYLNNGSTATVVMTTFENFVNACAYHYDTGSTTNFYTCTMKNSNVGIRYYNPNVNIPVYDNPVRVTFNNVPAPVGINGGTISNSYTWLTNDYSVFGHIMVYNSSSTSCRLTIDAGSTLRFAEGKSLAISDYYNGSYWYGTSGMGELYAEGTEENPITFTALNGETGGWWGIRFGNPSDNNASQVSLLKHCVIEKGTTNVYLDNTNQPSIENCDIRYASGKGVNLSYSGNNISGCEIHDNGTYGVYSGDRNTNDRLVEISDCNFHDNSNYGLYFRYPMSVGNVLNNLQFSNNLADGIGVGEGTISANRTWSANEYHILGHIMVYNSSSTSCRLTIDAGSTLRFAEGKSLAISDYYNGSYWYGTSGMGELYAEGTEENPITFTALNGETGGWWGIRFGNPSDNNTAQVSLLKHCIIEKATTNLYLNYTNQPTIENCDIKLASGKGINLSYSSPSIKLSRIHSNGTYGIYLDNNCSPTIGNNTLEGNDIVNNGTKAIYQNGSTNIDMAYNFLGIVDSLDIERDLVYDKLDNSNKGRINVFPVSMLPITGNVVEGTMLYDGNPAYTMPGSTVMVKTFADSLLYQTTTDAVGHFTIDSLGVTGAKKMEFVPNVDVESCITTADALAVMLHYVHESMLTGSRLAAADVNRSFTVNGTDALLIQKRYVNQIETFPNGDMYYHLYDSVAYPIDTCQVLITALCYGDVNGSYHQLRDGIALVSDGQMLVGSEHEYDIPVRVQRGIDAGAISLKLAYPSEYIDIEAVTLPNGEEVMSTVNDGLLTISWYDLNTLYLHDEDLLLSLKVRTKDLSNMDESIHFGLGGYSEIADGSAVVLSDVVLSMPELATLGTVGLDEQNGNDLALSVYPNPMKDRCIVQYGLSGEGRVSFMVYDMLGNTVKTIEVGRQGIGQHEIELKGLASGMYVGRLVVSGVQEKVQIVKIVVE